MQLSLHEVHVWTTDLEISQDQEAAFLNTLSRDEVIRANRFLSPIHKRRFIAARGTLRYILSQYLEIKPQELSFVYGEHNKPAIPNTDLQFNLAHSQDIAIYGLTLDHEVGIDIEKIQHSYNPAIAERYFSAKENKELEQIPEEEKKEAFYRLWSRKEAIIKALGKGFSQSLATFDVSLKPISEIIQIEETDWSLISLDVNKEFASALATNQPINAIQYWHSDNNAHKIIKDGGY